MIFRCAFLFLTLSLTACGFDSHEVRSCALPPQQQSIDLDFDHWIPFAFSKANITVTVKIPPDSRSFHVVTLPQVAFDKYSQRRLLDVEYDYRSKSIEEMAEFELQASFVQLSVPLSTTDVNADALNRALRVAWRRLPPIPQPMLAGAIVPPPNVHLNQPAHGDTMRTHNYNIIKALYA